MMTDKLNKILCIEDDPDIQQILEIALGTVGGYVIEICSSGLEGVQKAPSFMPDLILLDVMMPGMDGPTTFKELQKTETVKHIPVIFLTAKVLPDEVHDYKRLGVIDIISKPFNPMNLASKIESIWSAVQPVPVDDFDTKLFHLKKKYQREIPAKLELIKQSLELFKNIPTNPEHLKQLIMLVHKIAGSSATYGFPNIHSTARSFELYLDSLRQIERLSTPLPDEILQMLDTMFNSLRNTAED
jgi:two-component system OmpR family response regulator